MSGSILGESAGREVGFTGCCCLSATWLRLFSMEGLSTFSSDIAPGKIVLRGDRGWFFRGELVLTGLEMALEMLLEMTLEMLLDMTLEMALESSSNVKLRGLTAPAIISVAKWTSLLSEDPFFSIAAFKMINRIGQQISAVLLHFPVLDELISF